MTYLLDIDIGQPLESVMDEVLSELEEAVDNFRKHRPMRVAHQEEVDVGELLAEHHAIPIIWDVDHVRDQRPELSQDQAWEVLQACLSAWDRLNDPMLQLIRQTADELFPPLKGKAALRSYLARIVRQIEALPEDESSDPAADGAVAARLDTVANAVKGG